MRMCIPFLFYAIPCGWLGWLYESVVARLLIAPRERERERESLSANVGGSDQAVRQRDRETERQAIQLAPHRPESD